VTTYERACPVDDACDWVGETIDRVTANETVHAHLVDKHPEVIVPNPEATGHLYTRPIYAVYRKVPDAPVR
jgi:hypothetical protein